MITINFASRNYRLIARIRYGLIAGSIILIVITAGMLLIAVSLRENVSDMDRKMQELKAADEQMRPALLERERLVKDLTAMSGLMEARKISWTRLLTSVETVVPVGVALKHVEFNPKDSSLTLNGMARSPESLRNMVVAMEKSASFKDPFLKHQSLEKGNISFNVVAVYREDKSRAVAQGKR
ncbi:MAG: PilN domain-containing protein [Nitrospirae bacterium]|nr:PilN domain-containing protein [Nitrospirota bacterium]